MFIYIASESGMPVNEVRERENFLIRYGTGNRLLSYYHINTGKMSKISFHHLIKRKQNENQRAEENLGTC